MSGGSLLTALDRINRAVSALGNMLDWSFDQLRPVMPAGLASAGRRSSRALLRLDANLNSQNEGVINTSLLGAVWSDKAADVSGARGVVGVLDSTHQFTIKTELSEAAARAGRSALALRLEQLSPIPPRDAAFASRRLSPAGEVPVKVEVSIARRSAIEAAQARLEAIDPDWRLVGAVSSTGKPELEFARSDQQPLGIGLKLVIIASVLAAALFAWGGRLSEGAMQLQAELGSETRDARLAARDDALLPAAVAAHQASVEAPTVADWMTALSGMSDEVEAFSALRVDGRAVALEHEGREIARTPTPPGEERLTGAETGEAAP